MADRSDAAPAAGGRQSLACDDLITVAARNAALNADLDGADLTGAAASTLLSLGANPAGAAAST